MSRDPMELVGRLTQRAADYRTGGPSSEHTAIMLDEAAACIREMVEKIDMLEGEIENIYFDLTED